MAAVKNVGRGYTDMDNAGQQRPLRVWEQTPRWHPRRWIGFTWRQRHYEWGGDGEWFYQTTKQRAVEGLSEQFDTDRVIGSQADYTRAKRRFGMARPRS